MSFLNNALFVALLVGLVHAKPNLSLKTKEIKRNISYEVKDGDTGASLLQLQANITIDADSSKASDYKAVSDFVVNKLTSLQDQPKEHLFEQYTLNEPLPLVLNLTVKEDITITLPSQPPKHVGVKLDVLLYANKKSQHEPLSMKNAIQSIF